MYHFGDVILVKNSSLSIQDVRIIAGIVGNKDDNCIIVADELDNKFKLGKTHSLSELLSDTVMYASQHITYIDTNVSDEINTEYIKKCLAEKLATPCKRFDSFYANTESVYYTNVADYKMYLTKSKMINNLDMSRIMDCSEFEEYANKFFKKRTEILTNEIYKHVSGKDIELGRVYVFLDSNYWMYFIVPIAFMNVNGEKYVIVEEIDSMYYDANDYIEDIKSNVRKYFYKIQRHKYLVGLDEATLDYKPVSCYTNLVRTPLKLGKRELFKEKSMLLHNISNRNFGYMITEMYFEG